MPPFVPAAVGRTELKYPEDRWRIALLPQRKKEAWYAAQEPAKLAESDKDFQAFWSRWYGGHLKLKRFVFKMKFWK